MDDSKANNAIRTETPRGDQPMNQFKPGDRVEIDLGVVKVEGVVTAVMDGVMMQLRVELDNGVNVFAPIKDCTLITPPEETYFLPIYLGGRLVPQSSGLPPKSLEEAIFSAAAQHEIETILEVVVRKRHGKAPRQDEKPTFPSVPEGLK